MQTPSSDIRREDRQRRQHTTADVNKIRRPGARTRLRRRHVFTQALKCRLLVRLP